MWVKIDEFLISADALKIIRGPRKKHVVSEIMLCSGVFTIFETLKELIDCIMKDNIIILFIV